MKKALKRESEKIYFINKSGTKRIINKSDKSTFPPNVSGDLSDVRGNLSDVSGNLSGVWGDIDDCKITDEERANGIVIEDLIQ